MRNLRVKIEKLCTQREDIINLFPEITVKEAPIIKVMATSDYLRSKNL